MPNALEENAIIKGFHSLLKDSLSQARGEGLISDDEIEEGGEEGARRAWGRGS
jgi:hypothetical protein